MPRIRRPSTRLLSIGFRAAAGFPSIATLVCFALAPGSPSGAEEESIRNLLAFATAWRDPQDYVWSRESLSQTGDRKGDPVRIKDFGRVRILLLSFEDESAVFQPTILSCRFETQLPGEPLQSGVSTLEGEKLPQAWLHPIHGFSIGVAPDQRLGLGRGHEASEVMDLFDFRGFVPNKVLQPGETWKAYIEKKPDGTFLTREETERKFVCKSIEEAGGGTRCDVDFNELVKITAEDPSRSSELREREGSYTVLLPVGLVEEATWKTTATELLKVEGKRSQIVTETAVTLVRRDVPPAKQKPDSDRHEAPLPRPPR